MKNTTVLKSSFFILFLCFTFFSCNRDSIVGTLETEELFSLNYGSFEDEFNLYTSNPEDYFSLFKKIMNPLFYSFCIFIYYTKN